MNHSKEQIRIWRESAQLMAMDNVPVDEILKCFPEVHKGTIKHRWLKGLIKNKKLEDIDVKEKIKTLYLQSLQEGIPITANELSKKFKRHPDRVRKYIHELRPKNNKPEYRKEIREYYQGELVKGNTPLITELKKKFHRDKQTIVKCIKDLIPQGSSTGVCKLNINGKKITYITLAALSKLTGRTAYHLRNSKELKKKRTALYNKGKCTYYYPLWKIFGEYPALKDSYETLKKLFSNDIMRHKPSNLTMQEFMVFAIIVHNQEQNVFLDRHPIKPTRDQITVTLNIYKIGKYDIDKCISQLKYLKYIMETDMYYLITRGPAKLLLTMRQCMHPKTGFISHQLCSRMFTSKKWAVTEKPTPEDYENSPEGKLILSLTNNNSQN